MKIARLVPRLAGLALCTISLAASQSAFGQTAGSISVDHAWLRATPHGAMVAGGYVTITNHGASPDTLLGASIPQAADGQVHTMSMHNGMMHMERLDKGLPIPAGQSVTLRPGGDHLMFMNPTAQLREGESVKGTLRFDKAGTLDTTFAVGGMAAKTAPGVSPTSSMSSKGSAR